MKNRISNFFATIITVLLVVACGGGGGGGGSGGGGSAPSIGQFIDAPVAGLTYVCGTYSGNTNPSGQFNYSSGSACTFAIGNVQVGSLSSIPSDGLVTPYDVAGVSRTANDDPNVIAIAQFLQSVGTSSGGVITISDTVRQNLQNAPAGTKVISSSGPLSQSALSTLVTLGAPSKTLIDPTVAKTAMATEIQQKGINTTIGVVPAGTPAKMSAVTVTSATVSSIAKGLSAQLIAKGNFTDGTTTVISSSVTWSSSNTSVATVNSAGLVTGVAAGIASISATSATGQVDSISVTVTPAVLSSIAVTPAPSSIAKGLTQQMVATGTYSDGTSQVITASTVTWSSSSSTVATISSSGIVMGVSTGSTTITATNGSITGTTSLTVSPAILQSLLITSANPNSSTPVGIAVQLTATGTYSDSTTANLSNLVTWVANNNASVSSAGLFTGINSGVTVPVTASYQGVTSSTFSMTLTDPTLQSIAITASTSTTAPTASQAPAGYSQNLIATGTYSNGTTQVITTSVTWSSATQSVATVTSGSAGGRVTGVAQGTSVITATLGSISKTVNFTVNAPVLVSIAVTAPSSSETVGDTEQLVATGTYSDGSSTNISSQVTWTISGGSSASISSSGLLTGVSQGNLTITASLNGITSANNVAVAVANSDPLLPYQWHIQNLGASAFSSTLPIAGNDMNVMGAWAAGYTGKGIKVAVVDTGLEVAHEDLSANVDQAHSYNFLNGTNNPTPSITGEDHGTQVAGIIGAVGFNNKGGRGVAYNSILRGYNLIASGAYPLNNLSSALGGATYSADNDIFNESFANPLGSLPQQNSTSSAITANALSLRGGKGAILVQSAGNEFSSNSNAKCTNANTYGVSCGDPATDTRRDGYGPIIVGAFDSDGIKSSYSNAGSALWVSAPGGEFGVDNAYLPNLFLNAYKPAIITTSLTGCGNASANGFSTNILNSLNSLGKNPFALNCQYTALMNGTSSAAPNVSAIVALMLEANPNLGFRDVKYILAKTAKKIDPTNSGVSSSNLLSGQTVVLDQGWVQNKAGYWFSNWYGFGAVDATAAVNMAKSYNTYLPPIQSYSSPLVYSSNATIPHNVNGYTMNFLMSPSFSTVEQVIFFTNLTTTTALTCNQFEITSPSGTKSIILHAANGYSSDGVTYQNSINNARIMTNAFYGEIATGTWTLRFLDFCPNGTTTFSTTDVQTLSISGH